MFFLLKLEISDTSLSAILREREKEAGKDAPSDCTTLSLPRTLEDFVEGPEPTAPIT